MPLSHHPKPGALSIVQKEHDESHYQMLVFRPDPFLQICPRELSIEFLSDSEHSSRYWKSENSRIQKELAIVCLLADQRRGGGVIANRPRACYAVQAHSVYMHGPVDVQKSFREPGTRFGRGPE